MDYVHDYQSPLGRITLASDGKYLIGLWFANGRHYGNVLAKEIRENNNLSVFKDAERWLDVYFSGADPDFTLPLYVRGSEFQRNVCRIMLEIPYGQTSTYGQIAAEIAREKGLKRMSAQAVGGAVGYNPISIIIPCHRVVGANGSLRGYGGGIERKVKLLELENTDMTGLFMPNDRRGE